jgi:hypothetical protein
MEPRFGHDFSKIRVHADSQAAESAKAVQAQAYTVGQDVVFGAGQYAPHSQAGRKRLAHELAHTLQQGAVVSGPMALAQHRAFEQKADTLTLEAEKATAPEKPKPAARTLQRQPEPDVDTQRCPFGEIRLGPGLPCFPLTLPGRDCPIGQVRLSPDFPCVPLRQRPTLLGGKLHLDLDPTNMGCRYSVTYSNPRELDCDTVWRNAHKGANPPEPLCGGGLVYDILSVSASGSGCPTKLEGLEVSETVTGDKGCTPPGFVWPAPIPCRIGPGGKLSGCTDTYSLCSAPGNLPFLDGCTEVVTQKVLVGGQEAETHHITFDLVMDSLGHCTATIRRV